MNLPNNSESYSNLAMQEVIRVPSDRIGVVIGKKGNTKLKIEELTSTLLEINGEDNSVVIRPKKKIEDPSFIWVAKDMIKKEEKEKEATQKLFEALDESDTVQEIYSNLKL